MFKIVNIKIIIIIIISNNKIIILGNLLRNLFHNLPFKDSIRNPLYPLYHLQQIIYHFNKYGLIKLTKETKIIKIAFKINMLLIHNTCIITILIKTNNS